MKLPLVSVVMPTYNVEKYVEEAINSILNQAFEDLEFFIIDDVRQIVHLKFSAPIPIIAFNSCSIKRTKATIPPETRDAVC